MRFLVLATAFGFVANQAAAELPPEQAALVNEVILGFKANDSRLGAVKARLKMVIERSPELNARPVVAQPPPPVPPAIRPGGVPVDPATVLIRHEPLKKLEWTAEIAGENRRFDIALPNGKEVISADVKGVTVHRPGQKQATLMPWNDRGIGASLQYDPRELGFLTMDENLLRLYHLGKIESAKKINRRQQETIIELQAKSLMEQMSLVIECSPQFGHLPMRVYYILNDERVTTVTDLAYQQVRVNSTPAWFLKSAVKRNAFPHQNKSPDDKKWGQVITTTVTELELDKLPPARDNEQSLPTGTLIQSRS
jgi:hypothetical protein